MLVFSHRGILAVLEPRAPRLLLPVAIPMATILPLTSLATGWAVDRSTAATAARSPLQGRILAGGAGVREPLAKQPGLSEARRRRVRQLLEPLASPAEHRRRRQFVAAL